jgi:hypothetical protein
VRGALIAAGLTLLSAAALPSAAAADPTTITTVPGTIVDASPTRVLYKTSDNSLFIRDVADPDNDTEVPIPPGRALADADGARLIPGGALYPDRPTGSQVNTHIHEWRNGATTDLGALNSSHSIVVAGNFAIWSNASTLTRRDVTTGTNDQVATDAGNINNDLTASGDVVYWDGTDYDVHRWHEGVTSTLAAPGTDWATYPRTDGTTTVYRRTPPCCALGPVSTVFTDGTTQTELDGSQHNNDWTIYGPYPDRSYRVNAGWIAYTGPFGTGAWTRAPDGTITEVAPTTELQTYLTGLNPAGQVMYGNHRNLSLAAGSAPAFPVESQPCCGDEFVWRSFWSDDHWYVVRPDSLVRLGVDTAITDGPPEFDSHDAGDFEFASVARNPDFTCKLDDVLVSCSPGHSLHVADLDDGSHTLAVSSTDPDDSLEEDPTPATATWTVDTSPPEAFGLAAPADGAAVADPLQTLSWQTATDSGSGIDSYEVRIDGQLRGTTGPTTTSIGGSSALSDGPHTWQVTAKNRAGLERVSAARTFTVDTVAPAAPGSVAPAADVKSTSARPTFTWSEATDEGTGIAGYDVEIDETTTRVGAGVRSFTPSTDLADGNHAWRVVSIDAAGNHGQASSRQIIIDTRPPTARLAATPDPALTGDAVQFEAGATEPGGGDLASYEWDLDGNGSYETDTGANAATSRVYDTPLDVQVGLRVTDSVGRSDTDELLLHVTPAPLPGPIGISINDGDQYTNDRDVTITARWPHFATSMIAANDGGFGGSDAFPVTAHFEWQLDSSGAERLPKTVYVRFQGGLAGNETYSDDIILDESAPQVLTATATAAGKRRYVTHVRGRDGVSGLASLQVTSNKAHPGAKHRYARTLRLKSSHKPRWARVIDRAGNRSRWHALKLRRR